MTPAASTRRIVDPDYATARSSISLPSPLDVDLAPQLLALAHAALAATHRALDSAHPILSVTSRLTEQPNLAHSEHFAILVLHAGSQLAVLLSEYANAVAQENLSPTTRSHSDRSSQRRPRWNGTGDVPVSWFPPSPVATLCGTIGTFSKH